MKLTPEAALAWALLVNRVAASAMALKSAKEATEKANAEGREATLADIRVGQDVNEDARDVLVKAIEDAEKSG